MKTNKEHIGNQLIKSDFRLTIVIFLLDDV